MFKLLIMQYILKQNDCLQMRETMELLCQLWKLMDSPGEEKRQFNKVMSILILPEEGITSPGILSEEIIGKVLSVCFCSGLYTLLIA
jgi:hypothetical protein